jgi:predicted outer membrane repeat protein
MFIGRLLSSAGLVLVALAAIVSSANATQPECKAINQSQDVAYGSSNSADPLGAAISEAASGDTIKVIGTCYGNFVVDKNLILTGRPSARQADVINGGGSGTVLSAIELTVRDLTITGGDTGVAIDGGSMSLMRTKVTGNAGRGIVNGFVASTTIEDSVVSDNHGGGVAGGLFGSISISNSTVRGNTGFGIAGARASVTISDSLIANNTGVGVRGSRQIQISNSVIEGNTLGGGIAAVDLGTVELTDSIVRANTGRRGGGISFDRSLFPNTITRSVVTGNSATEAGGGIYGPGEDLLSITDSTVSNNSANLGGGLFLFAHGGSRTEIENSTVTGNTAVYGGGIWNDGLLTLGNSAVTGNTATAAGGGISGAGTVALEGSATACGNTPDDWPGCST